ncbi:hypothetical protein EYR40_005995 [Pleurotus pulmonarius]|nr:hypothetical protein EYR36_005621 [Pleurotus pulmonarius]KAF4602778.1 hypothetical protein EYR40_005995 [Pleurotus pulmonarius]
MDSPSSQNSRIPLEIVSVVLKALEHDKVTLKNCSLTCTVWRTLCLPTLFQTLTILGDKGYMDAFRRFMIIAPHLRTHVRSATLHISDRDSLEDDYVFGSSRWLDDEHTESLVSSFPNILNADCFHYPLDSLSSAFSQMPITNLRLQQYTASPTEFLRVLAAGSKTLRSVTLDYIQCYNSSNTPPATQSVPKTTMSALEELNVTFCTNLPFEPETIQMPRLRALFVSDDSDVMFSECLPDALNTLAVDVYDYEQPLSSKTLLVENFCLISPGYWDFLAAVRETIKRYSVPSSIQHIEVVLHQDPLYQQPEPGATTMNGAQSFKTLPTELVSLVFQELYYSLDALKACSSTCKRWRSIALPLLLIRLCIVDGNLFLRAYQFFVVDAPGTGVSIAQPVREMVIDPHSHSSPLGADVPNVIPIWNNQRCILAFVRAFPRLKVLHCTLSIAGLISSSLPQSSITTLDIHGWHYDALSFTKLLRWGAGTLRSLTLQDIHFPAIHGGKAHTFSPLQVSMVALTELTLIRCGDLRFFPTVIQMPNVKTLRMDGCDMPPATSLPPSLEMLVIQRERFLPDTRPDSVGLFSVDNVVVICHSTDPVKRKIQHTIRGICVSSSIKHLELVLLDNDDNSNQSTPTSPSSSTPTDRFPFTRDSFFEDFVINLHKYDALERFIVTAEQETDLISSHMKEFQARVPMLWELGIMDVRVGASSVLDPQRFRYVKSRGGSWVWSRDW